MMCPALEKRRSHFGASLGNGLQGSIGNKGRVTSSHMITKLTTTRCWIGSAKVLGLAALAALVLAAAPANAAVTYSGSALGNNAGQTNSATATFALTISGTTTDLVVTLSNTAT